MEEAQGCEIRCQRLIVWLRPALLYLVSLWWCSLSVIPCQARGESSSDPAKDYVDQLLLANTSVVYSECADPRGKAVLVLPILDVTNAHQAEFFSSESVGKAVVFEFQDGLVVNAADVSIGHAGLKIGEVAQGGVYVINQMGKLMRELEGRPFRLLPPSRLDELITSKPAVQCKTPSLGR